MRLLRTKITRLKTKIIENFSEANKYSIYTEIDSNIIVDSLNESYNLLACLEDYNSTFEVVLAKKSVIQQLESADNNLKALLDEDTATEECFTYLLNDISQVRFLLKIAYVTVVEQPLRLDSEITEARQQLEELSSTLITLQQEKDKIEQIRNDSSQFIEELEVKHKAAIDNDDTISKAVENINKIETEVSQTNKNINDWNSKIKSIKENITTTNNSIKNIEGQIKEAQEKSGSLSEALSVSIKQLQEQLILNDKHQAEIQKTIEDVSRLGMAGSFKKRKDELRLVQFTWALLTILSVGGLIYLSYFIVKPILSGAESSITQLYFKLPIIASAVWLGWFCSKQYGFISRIREDYAYKYAISLAFEGYKNEAREINEELLDELLQLTILNLSKNPIALYDTKSNHGTPYNEIIDNLLKKYKRMNDNQD